MSSTVYLEDVDTSDTTTQEDGPPSSSAPSSIPSLSKSVSQRSGSTNLKRQRTLVDMFTSSQGKLSIHEPSSKKSKKLTTSGSSYLKNGSRLFGVQKLNAIPFSMSEYFETLADDQKRLLRLECEVMGKSWLKLLQDEIKKPYFIALKQFLWVEGVRGPDDTSVTLKIYPAPKNIYAWSNTPLGKVKIHIMGEAKRMIYIELKAEYPEFEIPNHGNLTAWARAGVLMLNTCLTVRAGEAGSHSNRGWEEFTDRVVDIVDKYGGANLPDVGVGSDGAGVGRGVVFLAWGAFASKRVAKLDKERFDQGKHLILMSAHPSPFSVDRGFRGNNHFKLANDWLENRYGVEGKVDWCCLDVKEEV
ncbi:hypothetical protein C0992_003304 [Termitomyces sp. T32_za158]|nr:hypothetical protein C0992_003304 [Termitomyces sp. T32_za158]